MKLYVVLAALLMSVFLLSSCGGAEEEEPVETPEIVAETEVLEEAEVPVEEEIREEELAEEVPEEEPEAPKPTEEETLGAIPDEVLPPADEPAVITVLSPQASGTRTESNGSATMDYSHCEDGYIMVAWWSGGSARLKVLMTGPSGTTYQYDLRTDGQYETFPLSDGSGSYDVGIYQNVSDSSYATVFTASLSVQLKDEFAAFLRPNQYISFTADSAAVQKAAQLCAGRSGNLDKVAAIYDYVIKNVTYDTEKALTVTSGYLPDVDDTLLTGKGICFDYAALMTAMLRSQSVPVKLIVGYTGDIYHAWISVWSESEGWMDAMIYFNGSEWKLMDPTFASNGQQSESIMDYIGNGANYTAKYQY